MSSGTANRCSSEIAHISFHSLGFSIWPMQRYFWDFSELQGSLCSKKSIRVTGRPKLIALSKNSAMKNTVPHAR